MTISVAQRRRITVAVACLAAIIVIASVGIGAPANPAEGRPKPRPILRSPAPAEGKAGPVFALRDIDGTMRSLSEMQGKPTVVFFYCGCPWCHECAESWTKLQRIGAIPADQARYLVVFQGDAEASKSFATETGLDIKKNTILPDTDLRVTETMYKSEVCPRVFVMDKQGIIRYTNTHKDDQARIASGDTIVAKTLAALHTLQAAPIAPSKSAINGSTSSVSKSNQNAESAPTGQ